MLSGWLRNSYETDFVLALSFNRMRMQLFLFQAMKPRELLKAMMEESDI
jgi:hypothetical protein